MYIDISINNLQLSIFSSHFLMDLDIQYIIFINYISAWPKYNKKCLNIEINFWVPWFKLSDKSDLIWLPLPSLFFSIPVSAVAVVFEHDRPPYYVMTKLDHVAPLEMNFQYSISIHLYELTKSQTGPSYLNI